MGLPQKKVEGVLCLNPRKPQGWPNLQLPGSKGKTEPLTPPSSPSGPGRARLPRGPMARGERLLWKQNAFFAISSHF